MTFVKKIRDVEVYQLSDEEVAQFGDCYWCIKAGKLNALDFKETEILYKAVSIEDAHHFFTNN